MTNPDINVSLHVMGGTSVELLSYCSRLSRAATLADPFDYVAPPVDVTRTRATWLNATSASTPIPSASLTPLA